MSEVLLSCQFGTLQSLSVTGGSLSSQSTGGKEAHLEAKKEWKGFDLISYDSINNITLSRN